MPALLAAALRKAIHSVKETWLAMLALELAVATIVTLYYLWPPANEVISRYAHWQHSGGPWATALASAAGGGVISELSLVYFQKSGRWSLEHLESMAFKSVMFFFGGAIVFEFYQYQALWFGDGPSWRIVLPKLLVDQFVFSTLWSTPYQTLMTRFQANRYSFSKLRREMNRNLIFDRMLPVLITNWMFWFPCLALIYSTPLVLQASLAVFGIAGWGLLLPFVAHHEDGKEPSPDAGLVMPELAE